MSVQHSVQHSVMHSVLHSVLSARLAAGRQAVHVAWPARTAFVPGDVVVDGVSLLARANAEGTPVVCIGPASAQAHGALDPAHVPTLRTVVVARVEHAIPALGGRPRQVWLECDLDACVPLVGEVRLIGRVSHARDKRWSVRPERPGSAEVAHLPDDLRRGDVLAVPCLGLVTPAELSG